jgi:hypothetical protein
LDPNRSAAEPGSEATVSAMSFVLVVSVIVISSFGSHAASWPPCE